MKTIKEFICRNEKLFKEPLAKIYGGGIVSSYWSESSGSCTTHYHDTFNDINGDGQRNAGEPGSICSETICDQDCIDG